MADLIVMTAEMAFAAQKRGDLSREQLVEVLQRCILPFPEHKDPR